MVALSPALSWGAKMAVASSRDYWLDAATEQPVATLDGDLPRTPGASFSAARKRTGSCGLLLSEVSDAQHRQNKMLTGGGGAREALAIVRIRLTTRVCFRLLNRMFPGLLEAVIPLRHSVAKLQQLRSHLTKITARCQTYPNQGRRWCTHSDNVFTNPR